MNTGISAFRARLLYYVADPRLDAAAVRWHEDGLLIVSHGKIVAAGDFANLQNRLPQDVAIQHFPHHLIVPGFIDAHVHFPQTDMIASPAAGLLPWLDTYTFPTERRFADSTHAREVAEFFLDELMRNGTTTAMVYCTVHPESVDAFFSASQARNLRMIAGKVLMDRNCPDFLQDTAERGVQESEKLIEKWHESGRQLYAITPRFAPTSTPAQLQLSGELAQRHPDVFIQSHVAENKEEIAWAQSLFPSARSYLDIYEHFGLLRPRAMYGHGIWLDATDRQRLHKTGAALAHCPTSNLFLGSGLFDFQANFDANVPLALASDVGGGNSFSMLHTMRAAYHIARLNGVYLPAHSMFYLATLGAAQSLHLQDRIGRFATGTEADFLILDPQATPLLARRSAHCNSLEEQLFVLAMLGDDRCIHGVAIAGDLQLRAQFA